MKDKLEQAFCPLWLDIKDLTHLHKDHAGAKETGGGHYILTIVSDKFDGQNRIKRHRMVYDSLKDIFEEKQIHALSIKAFSPIEWAQENDV